MVENELTTTMSPITTFLPNFGCYLIDTKLVTAHQLCNGVSFNLKN
jgi:hypothetical protein